MRSEQNAYRTHINFDAKAVFQPLEAVYRMIGYIYSQTRYGLSSPLKSGMVKISNRINELAKTRTNPQRIMNGNESTTNHERITNREHPFCLEQFRKISLI